MMINAAVFIETIYMTSSSSRFEGFNEESTDPDTQWFELLLVFGVQFDDYIELKVERYVTAGLA